MNGQVDELGYVVSFAELKATMREICAELNGRFLLPSLCPFLTATEEEGQINLLINDGTHFSFPARDVVSLPIANITVELLSRHLCHRFVERIGAAALALRRVSRIVISVSETQGQEARFSVRIVNAA